MKQITINITKAQIEEVLPILALQMRALESGTATIAQLEAINAFSPILMDIQKIQNDNTARIENFLASIEDMDEAEEKLEEIAEELRINCVYPKEASLEERVAYATLFMGELAKVAQNTKDPLEAIAWGAVGFNTFSEFSSEDEEIADYWMNLSETLIPLVEESVGKHEEEFPILADGAKQIIDTIKEYQEENS